MTINKVLLNSFVARKCFFTVSYTLNVNYRVKKKTKKVRRPSHIKYAQ